jgi:ethanolamine utilization protein EutN
MITGVVTGKVWATRRISGLPTGAFLSVEIDAPQTVIVAFDVLGTGEGEHVLVAQGSVAASWLPGPAAPVDALIVGAIDPVPEGDASVRRRSTPAPSPSAPSHGERGP